MSSARKLRDKALELREMAAAGGDAPLLEALLLVAEEFEQEAARLERDAPTLGVCRAEAQRVLGQGRLHPRPILIQIDPTVRRRLRLGMGIIPDADINGPIVVRGLHHPNDFAIQIGR
jgi:hypothetical protein